MHLRLLQPLCANPSSSHHPVLSYPLVKLSCGRTQSLSVSRLTLPLFETDRSSRPLSIPATVVQTSMPCFTQIGMATVRMRRPLPLEVGQHPSAFPLLDGRDVELGQFVPPEGAADQQRQDDIVALSLQCLRGRGRPAVLWPARGLASCPAWFPSG
jgi:hypothetical protein